MEEKIFRIRIKNGLYEFEIEGDKNFVDIYYKEIKKDFMNPANIKNQKAKVEVRINPDTKKFNESLTEFYKNKNPANHNDIILTIAYWRLKFNNLEEFKAKEDILAGYESIRLKKPGNIHQHISALNKDGYIMAGSKDSYYKLTLKGIEYVDNLLPLDRK